MRKSILALSILGVVSLFTLSACSCPFAKKPAHACCKGKESCGEKCSGEGKTCGGEEKEKTCGCGK